MAKPIPLGTEHVVFRGKLFEILEQRMKIGKKEVIFETARRSPGVRLLLLDKGKILLNKEFRHEQKEWDYRLPGGKVFDSVEEYDNALKTKRNMVEAAVQAAKKECLEETGLIPSALKHIYTTTPAATLDFPLYYFLVEKYTISKQGPQLEEGEMIQPAWFTLAQVKQMCLQYKIKEDMSVAVLLRFLMKDE